MFILSLLSSAALPHYFLSFLKFHIICPVFSSFPQLTPLLFHSYQSLVSHLPLIVCVYYDFPFLCNSNFIFFSFTFQHNVCFPSSQLIFLHKFQHKSTSLMNPCSSAQNPNPYFSIYSGGRKCAFPQWNIILVKHNG